MSSTRNIPSDGQALTTPDVQRIGDGAASADDRVHEVLSTPPSLGAKTVEPTSIETAAVNPRLLVVPGAVAGTVQLQPCALQVGSPSVALGVALEATLKAALASAAFAANASGVTRYDLLYATVQRTVNLTGLRVFKSTVDGSLSNQLANLADAPAVTLTILPNVGNVTPLATMPADNNGGANGEAFGSYNFPLALVALPNGYAGGGAIAQSIITQMWSGGFVQPHRVRGMRLLSLYYGAATEKPSSAMTAMVQGAERWGSDERFFGHFKLLTTTPAFSGGAANGDIIDNTIDWRHRFITAIITYHGSANQLPAETLVNPPTHVCAVDTIFSAGGNNGAGNGLTNSYISAGNGVIIVVDNAGNLRVTKNGTAPSDAANGDLISVLIFASDQLLTGM